MTQSKLAFDAIPFTSGPVREALVRLSVPTLRTMSPWQAGRARGTMPSDIASTLWNNGKCPAEHACVVAAMCYDQDFLAVMIGRERRHTPLEAMMANPTLSLPNALALRTRSYKLKMHRSGGSINELIIRRVHAEPVTPGSSSLALKGGYVDALASHPGLDTAAALELLDAAPGLAANTLGQRRDLLRLGSDVFRLTVVNTTTYGSRSSITALGGLFELDESAIRALADDVGHAIGLAYRPDLPLVWQVELFKRYSRTVSVMEALASNPATEPKRFARIPFGLSPAVMVRYLTSRLGDDVERWELALGLAGSQDPGQVSLAQLATMAENM